MRTDGIFHITGKLVNGRRFRPIVTTNYFHAMGINLWRGTVWVVGEDGKRKVVRRAWNG